MVPAQFSDRQFFGVLTLDQDREILKLTSNGIRKPIKKYGALEHRVLSYVHVHEDMGAGKIVKQRATTYYYYCRPVVFSQKGQGRFARLFLSGEKTPTIIFASYLMAGSMDHLSVGHKILRGVHT